MAKYAREQFFINVNDMLDNEGKSNPKSYWSLVRLSCLWRRSRRRMNVRIDELNQGLSLGLIVTVFTGMYFLQVQYIY
jgi:hypothetical protein